MMLLWCLLSCKGEGVLGQVTTADTAHDAVSVELSWSSPPLAGPLGGSQDHATVALRDDGLGMVIYSDDERLRAALVGDDALRPTSLDALANHGQIRASPEGWVAVATLNGGDWLAATRFDLDGEALGAATLVSSSHVFLPDLATTDEGGVAVSTDLADMGCYRFTHPISATSEVPCPQRIDPTAAIGTVIVDDGPDGTVVGWTELRPDGSLSVYATPGGDAATPYVVDELAWGAGMAGRPMIAVHEGQHLFVWRGASSLDSPVGSWLQAFRDGEPAGERYALGDASTGGDVERPALAGPAAGLVVVAFEQGDGLWLQVRDASDGTERGAALRVDDEPGRVPRRPSLDLVEVDGEVHGLVSWEAALPGSEVESADRVLRVRTFRVGGD